MFKGMLMTASEIASSNGLSLPTVLYRIKQGRPDNEIVAPPFSIPRGKQPVVASNRDMTVPEACYHLKRAEKAQSRHTDHYLNAFKASEPQHVISRLKLTSDKAQQSVMYWKERVRAIRAMADDVTKQSVKVPGRRGWVEPEVRASHLLIEEGEDQ